MKPYPAYKDSGIEWLGEIPKHWEIKKLKYVAHVETGITPPSDEPKYYENGKLNWFTPGDFNDTILLIDSNRKINYVAVRNGVAKIYESFSVLLVGIGATLGKIGIIDKEASSNQQINAITFKKGFNPFYGALYLKSISKIIVSLSNNSTLAILNQSQTKDILILIPPLEEQNAIAEYLDRKTAQIDELIKKNKKMVELLKEKRQAIISNAVTKGLDPKAKMKDSGVEWLGEIPEGWEVKRLRFLLNKNDGGVWGDDTISDNGDIVLRSTEVNIDGSWSIQEPAIRKLASSEKKKALLEIGDILVTKSSGSKEHIGKTAYVDEKIGALNVYFSNFMQRLRMRDKYLGKFFYYIFNNYIGRDQMNFLSQTTTGLINLNGSVLGEIKITYPPKEDAKEIIYFLDQKTSKIDESIKIILSQIEKLKEYRQALISNVVTGKIDVRG